MKAWKESFPGWESGKGRYIRKRCGLRSEGDEFDSPVPCRRLVVARRTARRKEEVLSWPSNRVLYVCAVTIVKRVDVSGMGGENTQFGHFSYATSGTWLTVSCRPLAAWSTKARVRALVSCTCSCHLLCAFRHFDWRVSVTGPQRGNWGKHESFFFQGIRRQYSRRHFPPIWAVAALAGSTAIIHNSRYRNRRRRSRRRQSRRIC